MRCAASLPLVLAALALPASASEAPAPDARRSQALVRMVRQDCGSCHGMRLTGGLGPALTAQALADRPLEMLTAVIYRGRPGTPMPGWQAMLSESEAQWIAQRLRTGFPEETR
ncbi:c-type cytochrome [Piscinibacter sp.]|uniref:c-type cytochrome n=1 Tax=Piscinibacter sp. TaxID=1903157 RepID=UPI0039E2C206